MTSRNDVSHDPSEAFRELAQIELGEHSIESVMT